MSDATTDLDPRHGEQRDQIVSTAARLFREIGFQKTTVADIARALGMSPANVYRFFAAKSEIHQAVARSMMDEVETAARAIANGPGSAAERLTALIVNNEKMNSERYISDRKIHDMVEVALNESWPIIDEHIDRIDLMIEQVVESGVRSGEFCATNAKDAALLVHAACIRYCHPRLMIECADRPEPTSRQMMAFLLKALRAPE